MPASPDIHLVRTDIAGFFGFAERGPLVDLSETDPGKRASAAVRLTSWKDFRHSFGGYLPYSYLAYAVRGFFATGGKTCYVARIGVANTPPVTAVMPLPAGITSTQIANFADLLTSPQSDTDDADAAAAQSQIQLDNPVSLNISSVIAIGETSVNAQRTVTGVIDSKTVTVQPPIDAAQIGARVFALSGPGVATPVTSIVASNTAGASQIEVDSSDVNGIAPGSLIAIGDPLLGECVSIASVVGDQQIMVQPALSSVHAVGEAVYPIVGSALTMTAAEGATSLLVKDASSFVMDDLVSIEGGGVREIRVLTAEPAGSALQLGLPLKFSYDVGTVVRKYTAALTVSAYSPGEWGNRIKLTIKPLSDGVAATRFSMLVTVDQGDDPTQPLQQEFYPILSLDPYDPYPLTSADAAFPAIIPGFPVPTSPIYAVSAVNSVSQLIQVNAPVAPPGVMQTMQLLVNSGPLQTNDLYLEGGYDGTPDTLVTASIAPQLSPCSTQVSAGPAPSAASAYAAPPSATDQDFYNALDVLGLIDEIAILCCPDAAGPPPQINSQSSWSMANIQQAMVNQCVQKQYRVAVLDTPMSLTPAQAFSWVKQSPYSAQAARFAAVYYPWLKVPDELGMEGPNRAVPPSGHIAGAYAFTDNNSGVQKPPANVELQFVSDLQLTVTNQQQGFLNPMGVNCIRSFPGRGICVWGARALSQDPNWRYIHRRRLMSMIEDSVEQASRWIVFRTNDADLRRMLTHSLSVFLQSIWLAGGLEGARPSEAYVVKCDSTNNTPTIIDAGQLVCQVGVAIAAPMEFLQFEMRRSVAGAQVVEA